MKYKVTLYQEIYTFLEIEAKSEDEARDLVLSGEFDDAITIDNETKTSEIFSCEEIKEDKPKPLSFEQWCSDVDIESQYEAFHDEYGDAAALLCEYKQYHYEEYLESFKSQ